MKIETTRDMRGRWLPEFDEAVEVWDHIPCKVELICEADTTDPLGQRTSLLFRVGARFGGRVVWTPDPDFNKELSNIMAAVRAIMIYSIDNAAELRDHLKAAL